MNTDEYNEVKKIREIIESQILPRLKNLEEKLIPKTISYTNAEMYKKNYLGTSGDFKTIFK
jgi:hypothetical protein